MAIMTLIDRNSEEGAETLSYIAMIRDGLAGSRKQEGLRAHSAASTVVPMKTMFGISDSDITVVDAQGNHLPNAGAEVFRDRLNAVNAGNLSGLQEFIDVTRADPTKVSVAS